MPLKSKYAIFERFNFETLYNTFLGLQSREQLISVVVAGILLILIVIVPISLASGKLSQMEKAISSGREQINDVVREIGEYNKARSQLNAIESQLKGDVDVSISTTLEKLAEQINLKDNLGFGKGESTTSSDIFDEKSAEVKLSRVTLSQLVEFLYKIESEKTRILRIKKLTVAPRFDNRKLLDATALQVSTFIPSSPAPPSEEVKKKNVKPKREEE